MPNLVPTQAVVKNGSRLVDQFAAEVAVSIADVVYLNASNKWDKANNVTALAAGQNAIAIVTVAAAADAYPTVLQGLAEIDLGVSIGTALDEIIVSGTDGKMAPKADLAADDFYTRVGHMKTDSILAWEPRVTGLQK